MYLYRKNILQIFFSKTFGLEKLNFIYEKKTHSDIVKKSCPQGSGWVTIDETVFIWLCIYLGKYCKNLLKNHWARIAEIYMTAF
jgi:hypothetical protein